MLFSLQLCYKDIFESWASSNWRQVSIDFPFVSNVHQNLIIFEFYINYFYLNVRNDMKTYSYQKNLFRNVNTNFLNVEQTCFPSTSGATDTCMRLHHMNYYEYESKSTSYLFIFRKFRGHRHFTHYSHDCVSCVWVRHHFSSYC